MALLLLLSLFCVFSISLTNAFRHQSMCTLRPVPRSLVALPRERNSRVSLCMVAPKPSGFATTREGKQRILERTRALLQNSTALIAAPIGGVSMEQIDMLRRELPPQTIASVVKNKLLALSVKDTPFEAIIGELKQETMFFFIAEDARKPTYEAFVRWQKEIKRQDPEHALRFIALDNDVFKGPKIEEVAKLPTKQELMAKIASNLKQIPLRLTMNIKEISNQLGRAMHALKDKLESEEKGKNPEGAPPAPAPATS